MHTKDIQALAAVALFYIVIESLGVTCPILFLTGISCAGCGMSRAWLSLLRLDLAGAFAFHPLFWLPVPPAEETAGAALPLGHQSCLRVIFQCISDPPFFARE